MQTDLHGSAASPRPTARAVVVGAGTMGTGIAMTFADAGIPVRLVDASGEALERARATIERTYAAQVGKGRIEAGERERRLALLAFDGAPARAAGADGG